MAAKFNIKAFFINHCEKVVGVLIALLAMWGLTGTTWETAKTRPEQLISEVDKVKKQIAAKTAWPENERAKFVQTVDIANLATELGKRDKLDFDRFTTQSVWHPNLIPVREKYNPVVVLAPTSAEVSPVSVPIAFRIEPETNNEDDSQDVEVVVEDEEARKRRIAREKFGGAGNAQTGGFRNSRANARNSRANIRGALYGDDDDDDDDDDGLFRRSTGVRSNELLATASREVRWQTGISVRMLVNLRDQRHEIAKALHINRRDIDRTGSYVDYQGIDVQRQELRQGEWTDWDNVRLEDLVELFATSLGTADIDIVSPAVTRPEITMPLLRRGAGRWLSDDASHSELENFVLDAEEQDLMNRIVMATALDAYQAEEEQKTEIRRRGGFGEVIQSAADLKAAASTQFESEEEHRKTISAAVRKSLGDEMTEEQKAKVDEILDSMGNVELTADDRRLLVRFMDFTAEGGGTYRYRVRLKMFNPNYQVPADMLVQPEEADKGSIVSDWSESTDAVMVPQRYRNHMREVSRSLSDLKPMRVNVGIYYEGDGILPVMNDSYVDVGMPIGGKARMERVDLEKEILEEGAVIFDTEDVLAGALVLPELTASNAPKEFAEELKSRGRRYRVGTNLTCVVDHNGEIHLRQISASTPALRDDNDLAKNILANYEDWRYGNEDGPGGSGFSGDDDDDDDDGGGRQRGRRRGLGMGNALSRMGFGSGGMRLGGGGNRP